jgi:hypothetical protein
MSLLINIPQNWNCPSYLKTGICLLFDEKYWNTVMLGVDSQSPMLEVVLESVEVASEGCFCDLHSTATASNGYIVCIDVSLHAVSLGYIHQ